MWCRLQPARDSCRLKACPTSSYPFGFAGFVAGRFDGSEHAQEVKEDGLKKMPILGATGKESAQREFITIGFIDVNDGEVTLSTGGDIEAKAELGIFEF